MSAIGSVLGAQVVGGGLGALDDAVSAIESALGGISDALQKPDSLKDALKAFGHGTEKGGALKDAFDAIKDLDKGGIDAALDPLKKIFGVF